MSYYGIIGNRTYIFEDVEDYLLALEIMNDLQGTFERRLNNYDTPFEISDKPVTTNYAEKVDKISEKIYDPQMEERSKLIHKIINEDYNLMCDKWVKNHE